MLNNTLINTGLMDASEGTVIRYAEVITVLRFNWKLSTNLFS